MERRGKRMSLFHAQGELSVTAVNLSGSDGNACHLDGRRGMGEHTRMGGRLRGENGCAGRKWSLPTQSYFFPYRSKPSARERRRQRRRV